MKTAGEILTDIFDEDFFKKAKGYSELYNSWKEITEKNGISGAADNSRIKNFEKGILLIEVDHPGWKQILQTKQSKLLHDFQIRFSEFNISGIYLVLGKSKPKNDNEEPARNTQCETEDTQKSESEVNADTANKSFDAIKDEDFKESLRNLGQTIASREKK